MQYTENKKYNKFNQKILTKFSLDVLCYDPRTALLNAPLVFKKTFVCRLFAM